MRRRVSVLVNPAAAASGRARATVERILQAMASQGIHGEVAPPRPAGQLAAQARERAAHADVLLAAGGDGTVREVASGLLQAGSSEAVLCILPVGTGNDLATQVGLTDPGAVLGALTAGEIRTLDVIEVQPGAGSTGPLDYALLFAATGFAVELLRRTSPRVKRLFGRRFSYSIGFLRALLGYRVAPMTLTADGRHFSGPMFHVGAGNSEWAGGGMMRLSPGARLDDGRLELCLIQGMGRGEALRRFPMLLRGTFPGHPKVRYFPGYELTVTADPPLPLALDGDVTGCTPATFRVRPAALRVLVPPGSDRPSSLARACAPVTRAQGRTSRR